MVYIYIYICIYIYVRPNKQIHTHAHTESHMCVNFEIWLIDDNWVEGGEALICDWLPDKITINAAPI